ncbi:MAG: amidohydrolase family protein [Synergistaceae bacterium]|nr:amidohydrolase family protein [Synergistaceae bacterium]
MQNGTIVASGSLFEGNIYVAQGKITAVTGKDVVWEARRTEDASGRCVFPGAIDVHVHLNDPGYTWREDFEHGTLAAAAGGVTTVLDMPLQNEPALTDASLFRAKHAAVRDKALVNYGFWGGLVEDVPEKMQELHDAGVVAFKIFIGPVSSDYRSLDMGAVREILQKAASLGALVGFHAEDYSIIKHEETRVQREGCGASVHPPCVHFCPDSHSGRYWGFQGGQRSPGLSELCPPEPECLRGRRSDFLRSRPLSAELIAVENVVELVRETGAKVHICHVSHPDVAERIRRARLEGLPVSAETCTHYLVYSEDDFLREGMRYKCAPPLRDRDARERLWNYVVDGTLQCVASDHSPCAPHEKDEKDEKDEKNGVFEAWGGISGVQTTMQVFYDHAVRQRHLSPTLLSRRLSEGPARVFGLYGRKGAIEAGFDADFVVFDPEREWEITSDSLLYLNPISAFAGLKGKGLPVATFVRGELVCRNEEGSSERTSPFGCGRLERR